MKEIYLDAASTVKSKREVIKAMLPYFEYNWHNPSALYKPAKNVKETIKEARNVIGRFINAEGKEIYFTSSGSESNCWAITGFVNECLSKGKMPIIITSTIEHKSIIECVENLNAEIMFLGVNKDGFINIDALEQILMKAIKIGKENTLNYYSILVSVQYANNEIGTIQDIKKIAAMVHEYGGIFHTDAVQVFGCLPIDVKELNIDLMSVSGHKIGCPKGIGFLYIKDGINIKPLIYGTQMDNMRGGTENVPYIMGMKKAIELIKYDVKNELEMNLKRNYFINLLKELGCTINGTMEYRLSNNINVTFPQNITGESLVYMLDMCGIYVATGSACNSTSIEPSYVLRAIGLNDEKAIKTLRITLTRDISTDDINKVIEEIKKSIKIIEMNNK